MIFLCVPNRSVPPAYFRGRHGCCQNQSPLASLGPGEGRLDQTRLGPVTGALREPLPVSADA